MNIRLTPRELNVLKTLAGEAGMRPGELVTRWVEERIEAERGGGGGEIRTNLATRVEELAARIAALESGSTPPPASMPDAPEAASAIEAAPMPRRRGRPPKAAAAEASTKPKLGRPRTADTPRAGDKRVPLHQEIIAVITERGPQTAAELASAIVERGVFRAPRSGKPLDAATVNSRVSNPVYRSRFRRVGHQIALAED